MENTFRKFRKTYRCQSKDQAFEILDDIFGTIADLPYWISKVSTIQNSVFDSRFSSYKILPDAVHYNGQVFLKLINASTCLTDFPAIEKEELKWTYLIDDLIERRHLIQDKPDSFYSLLEYYPRHLKPTQVLDPSRFVRKFFKRKKLKSWIRRWNHFRETAFYSFSVTDGDEGEYHKDFQYFLRLTEACYLIYVRFSPTQNSTNHAAI
jgi:hypothetical protein